MEYEVKRVWSVVGKSWRIVRLSWKLDAKYEKKGRYTGGCYRVEGQDKIGYLKWKGNILDRLYPRCFQTSYKTHHLIKASLLDSSERKTKPTLALYKKLRKTTVVCNPGGKNTETAASLSNVDSSWPSADRKEQEGDAQEEKESDEADVTAECSDPINRTLNVTRCLHRKQLTGAGTSKQTRWSSRSQVLGSIHPHDPHTQQ